MIPFHAICSAFARLPPFADPPPREELGNALPLWHGIDHRAIQAAMDPAFLPPNAPTLVRNLTLIRSGVTNLAERLMLEFDRDILDGEDDAFLDIKIARLTDALIGSVTDWNDPAKRLPLHRFYAIAEDFYVKALLDLVAPPDGRCPFSDWPVATFSDTQALGIHTISPDVMHRIANVPIGLISLPASYAGYPVLWAALAHEICGHDIVRAFDDDPATDSQLYVELRQSFDGITGLTPGWKDVWQAWLEEAIADVFGLAVMGPTFAIGMAAWLSTANAASDAWPPNRLGTLTNFIWISNAKVSEHPPNLIRLHIMAGALQALATNPNSVAGTYIGSLDAMIEQAAAGQTSVAVLEGSQNEAMFQYDTTALARDARRVGAHIVNASLPVLRGRSVRDLMAWDAGEEARTAEIAELYLADQDRVDDGLRWDLYSSIVMMAGAMKALVAAPGKIEQINCRLNQALDHRYLALRACEPPPPGGAGDQPAATATPAPAGPFPAGTPD